MLAKKNARRQGGFTLIEILLVLAILMGIGVVELKRDAAKSNEIASIAVGKQLVIVGAAVEQYIASRVSVLQSMADPNCVATGNYCDLNIAALIAAGYLPGTFDNSVQFGGGYTVRIARIPPPVPTQALKICPGANPAPIGCAVPYPLGAVPLWQYGVQGLVFTAQPWTIGGGADVNWNALGVAARHAGPLAGVTQAGMVAGLYAGWSGGGNFGPGVSNGQLAYLAGSQASLWSQFLERDGNRPMTGNFDAGSFNVLNMRDMFINGPISNPRNKNLSSLLPNWIFKGVYAAKDGDFVPSPVCDGGGAPRIKVLMQLMQGTKSGFYYDKGTMTATNSQGVAQADLAANASRHQLNNWADDAPGGWVVHFEDKFSQDDAGGNSAVVKGEGLAELYCHYPDQ